MKTLRRALVLGVTVFALGGLLAPGAWAMETMRTTAPMHSTVAKRIWHATVQCQIVRIRDNHVVGYERANGSGKNREAAINDAKRNVHVPQGHYKRHCAAKRVW